MFDSLLILLAIIGSYAWISIPELRAVSFQLSLALMLLYFISKRLRGTRWHHILPTETTLETAFLTAGVVIVVGSTGGLTSPFLPLFHLLLFISVLTVNLPANIVKMVGLTVFLWATAPHPISRQMAIELLSLPFLMPLMVLARLELEEARAIRHMQSIEDSLLTQQETRTLMFLSTFLRPKLAYLQQLLLSPEANQEAARKQIALIDQETQQVITELDRNTDPLDQTE